MGLHIKLRHKIFPPNGRALALSRLHFAKLALKYFVQHEIFRPVTIQLWINATSQLLGGKLDREYKYTETDAINGLLDMRFKADDPYNYKWYNSIIVINGSWKIFKEDYNGYVSINNNKYWRRAYQDIEIDAYGPRDKNDLVELLMEDEQFTYIIDDLIKYIVNHKGSRIGTLSKVFISIGPPKFGVVEDIVGIHVSNWREIISMFYDQMKLEKDEWYKDQVIPIHSGFFKNQLTSEDGIEQLFNEFREENQITQFEGGSITYIAKSTDSFMNFYKKFKTEIFKKAAEKLPHAEDYKTQMFTGIGRDILKERQSKLVE